MKFRSFYLLVAAGFMLLLAGCAGGSEGPGRPTPGHVLITGKLVAPNGITPVSGATVTLEGATIAGAGVLLSPAATACSAPEGDDPYVCTEPDGTFKLEVEAKVGDSLALKAVKGSWQSRFQVALTTDAVKLGDVRLSADPAKGAPRIAVAQGDYDDIEGILSDLGYDFDFFENHPAWVTPPENSISRLFELDDSGKARLFSYDIVFVNCGTAEWILLAPENVALIREYVAGGGRLYVSDLSYDVAERAFPEYIDFYGDDDEEGAAQVGPWPSSQTVDATVKDPGLAAWLATRDCGVGGCIDTDTNTVKLGGFLPGWAVMLGAEATPQGGTVKVWVDAYFETLGRLPLTVSFAHGGGLVLFTSYHNFADEDADYLVAQRYVLEYLVFEF